jgi:hypothetical protein
MNDQDKTEDEFTILRRRVAGLKASGTEHQQQEGTRGVQLGKGSFRDGEAREDPLLIGPVVFNREHVSGFFFPKTRVI